MIKFVVALLISFVLDVGSLNSLEGDAVCGYRGYDLRTDCKRTSKCEQILVPATRRAVCWRKRCCSIALESVGTLRDSGVGQVPAGVARFCANGGSFSRFTGNLCTPLSPALCPSIFGYNGQGSVVQLLVRCIHGYCCSTEEDPLTSLGRQRDPQENPGGLLPVRPSNSRAFCYDGTESSRECRSQLDCSSGTDVDCIQGLCCPVKLDERNFACAGLAAVKNCFANSLCDDGLVCTASKYCCECHYGQPQPNVKCGDNRGSCKSGYECTSRGYCCPRCPGNSEPYGSCYSGKCASGFSCQPAGNICCYQNTFLTRK